MIFSRAALVAAASLVFADDQIPNCGVGLAACPEKYPCCSIDGICGNGYVCLGGCDPRFSNSPGSCMPMPVCQSGSTTFTSTDQISTYADYMGDASKSQWSYLGNVTAVDGKVRAQLFETTTGTTISSSNYVWYGKVSIKMKTSHNAGVVSDFILLSSVKDEVDYELVGNNLEQAQTNFYWHGALDYTKMVPAAVSDTYQNEHEYTIDWKEDQIDWIIDGNTVRTLKKSDTFNSTSNTYSFPQTPARVQFGLWPAGDSPAQGTSEWAGGKIDWSAADITGQPGYFFVEITSVDIECYDAPSGTDTTGSKAYIYNSKDGLEGNVEITDDSTVLLSSDGTGSNPEGSLKGQNSSSSVAAGATLSGFKTSSQPNSTAVLTASFATTSSPSSSKKESSATSAASESGSGSKGSSASSSGSGSGSNSGAGAGAGADGSSSSSLPTATESEASTGAASGSAGASSASRNDGSQNLIPGFAAALALPFAFLL